METRRKNGKNLLYSRRLLMMTMIIFIYLVKKFWLAKIYLVLAHYD